ncbi:sporulation transcriptional regulator SpoIIID [Orenia metallireducens]|jgi:putative DeoR family transcriptional regulator (stage III sporulation protein D)|uniref:Sporulation transcriptional regulator SpoIIID n=1 Tax=Orenia metallireducens TaxID=1413210 RepID=A0A1C0A679_9FIRM|nr:sporulation transcriptional regulator SpoIIID [Orenia metallireducens]OCL25638.1 sporulation transcriptional regulator SpoIIID [Orenia metallireducens]
MKDYIHRRVMEVSEYIIETKATVRQAAKVFGVSKSTIHKDITERLDKINPQLADEIKDILEYNKSERHFRGGEATRKKYLKKKISK